MLMYSSISHKFVTPILRSKSLTGLDLRAHITIYSNFVERTPDTPDIYVYISIETPNSSLKASTFQIEDVIKGRKALFDRSADLKPYKCILLSVSEEDLFDILNITYTVYTSLLELISFDTIFNRKIYNMEKMTCPD